MSYPRHEHYLPTEGRFNPNWLEPVDSSIQGVKVWRFPHFIEFNGVRHDRVLEIDQSVEMGADTPSSVAFVGRLATGWLVTVETQPDSYSIHLALEPAPQTPDTSYLLAEAARIAEAASQPEMATAA